MDSVHWTVEFFLKEMLNKCFNFATILFDMRWCWAILMDLNWLRAFFNVDGAEINGWAHFSRFSFPEMHGKTTGDMCEVCTAGSSFENEVLERFLPHGHVSTQE